MNAFDKDCPSEEHYMTGWLIAECDWKHRFPQRHYSFNPSSRVQYHLNFELSTLSWAVITYQDFFYAAFPVKNQS